MRLPALFCAAAMLAGCATAPGMQRVLLGATLTGHQAAPGPGDLGGTGTAELRLDPGASRICWQLNVRGIEAATAAHVHRGAAGSSGPPVVTLTAPGADGRSEGCVELDQGLAREIALAPHLFYVNVHNRPFPAGAIRGQLRQRGGFTPERQPGG